MVFENSFALGYPLGRVPNYDVSPDGEELLFVERHASTQAQAITIVLNWTQELLERVPVN